jgi:hypothetical protein
MDEIIYELKKIEQRKGIITPSSVVEAARDQTSPLHAHFTWDDTEAAEAYREWQARGLLKRVTVKIEGKVLPAFHNVVVQVEGDGERQGYISTSIVLKDKGMTKQIIQQAIDELIFWEKKYADLKELSGVVDVT